VGLAAQRHPHRCRAGKIDQERVGLERAPGVDDFRAGLAGRREQLLVTPTEPQPTAMCSGGTANRAAIASVSATAPLSGYLLTCPAAAAMTLTTEGSGPKGDHSTRA